MESNSVLYDEQCINKCTERHFSHEKRRLLHRLVILTKLWLLMCYFTTIKEELHFIGPTQILAG